MAKKDTAFTTKTGGAAPPAPRPAEKKLKLTKSQHETVRGLMLEVLEIRKLMLAKEVEFKRLTDMIERDADIDPEKFTVTGLDETDKDTGNVYLKLALLAKMPAPETAPQK